MKLIKFPKISKELAEEIGIHIGDGSMGIYSKCRYHAYTVCGSIEDCDYLLKVVKPLIERLYGLVPNRRTQKKGKSLDLVYGSKRLVLFKARLGLPVGPKNNICIPEIVRNSNFVLDCLRGIFDTDGTILFKKRHKLVHYYPVIKLCCKSKPLIEQVERIFESIGIRANVQYDVKTMDKRGFSSVTHQLHINGADRVKKFIEKVGFSNSKHMTKYLVWKKCGHLEPGTTLEERFNILNQRFNPRNKAAVAQKSLLDCGLRNGRAPPSK